MPYYDEDDTLDIETPLLPYSGESSTPSSSSGAEENEADVTLGAIVEHAVEGASPAPLSLADLSLHAEKSSRELLDDAQGQASASTSKLMVSLPMSTLVSPKSSLASGFVPPLPKVSEHEALQSLMAAVSTASGLADDEDYVEIDLDNFSIYVDVGNSHYSSKRQELRSLHYQATNKKGYSRMFFDGILMYGSVRHYVSRVPFLELPIGNYGSSAPSVDGEIWIRSERNKKREIYYRLKNPSIEYARFYTPFLWVADLGKHFVDYCSHKISVGKQVRISHFKSDFSAWLHTMHQDSPNFLRWHSQLGREDFRSSVNANSIYLWKESSSVLGAAVMHSSSLAVFKEILDMKQYKAIVSNRSESPDGEAVIPATTVTPYILECFGDMEVGQVLHAIEPSQPIDDQTRPGDFRSTSSFIRQGKGVVIDNALRSIKPGDVISTHADDEKSGTKWKSRASKGFDTKDVWYALVQKVHNGPRSSRWFDVTWLYRPDDTPCGQTKYPWHNELFLSDHCTCEEGRDASINQNDVLGIHTIDWHGNQGTKAEFFIRQLYQHAERRWVTLKATDLTCKHIPDDSNYSIGDTILLDVSAKVLEPFKIEKLYVGARAGVARMRRLLRRRAVDKNAKYAPPNELVYSDQFITSELSKVKARCLVRFFSPDEKILTPYDRQGTGNAFYITHREVIQDGVVQILPLNTDEDDLGQGPQLRQGFHPDEALSKPKLRALDLFSGCGNLGRGLEDSGAVEARWVNDIWDVAIHAYMANADTDKVHPFLGSVDDLLRRGLQGRFSESVPAPGQVDLISGGSPCPGFSRLTTDKTTLHQIKNRSLVASFASFVDFYRPKYAVLENVTAMVATSIPPSQDVFSQLISAMVGLGYQCQIMLGNSWEYGAPQGRPRVFVCVAAPGLRLPETPFPSHAHPDGFLRTVRKLGRMNNDEAFVASENEPRAFNFITAAESTADLPDIGDAKPDICVPYPDHRLSCGVTEASRNQILQIPLHPWGMSFATAWNGGDGVMTEAQRRVFPDARQHRVAFKGSKGWKRVAPNTLFSTVTTACSFTDARVGRLLHWQQQRPLTVMEARRAQGIPDEEVLVGNTTQQWKMIGNAVARPVALAIGLAIREAWLGTLHEEYESCPTASVVADIVRSDHISQERHAVGVPSADKMDDIHSECRLSSSAASAERITSSLASETTATTASTEPECTTAESNGTKRKRASESLVELLSKKPRSLAQNGTGCCPVASLDAVVSTGEEIPQAFDFANESLNSGLSRRGASDIAPIYSLEVLSETHVPGRRQSTGVDVSGTCGHASTGLLLNDREIARAPSI